MSINFFTRVRTRGLHTCLTPTSVTAEPLLSWLLTLIYFCFINESSSTFVIHTTCRSISRNSRTFYMCCIELLRKNVCFIRVATTKIMKKTYAKCVMRPSTVGVGGWVGNMFVLRNQKLPFYVSVAP